MHRHSFNPYRSIAQGFGRKIGKWADAFIDLATGRKFSKNEGRLAADAYSVKRKLGRSFFTRRLSPGTRRARVYSLTLSEKQLARTQGWI